jgi:hypothetical protein
MLLLFSCGNAIKVKPESIIVVLSMMVIVLIFSHWRLHWIFWKVKRNSKENGYSVGYFQSGLSNEEHSKVSQLIVSNNISRVIGIGETISAFKDKFVNCIRSTIRLNSFLIWKVLILKWNHFDKGARSFQFEEIVYLYSKKKLMRPFLKLTWMQSAIT